MVNSMLESRIKGYSVELRDHGNQKTKQMVELEREPKFSIVLNLAVTWYNCLRAHLSSVDSLVGPLYCPPVLIFVSQLWLLISKTTKYHYKSKGISSQGRTPSLGTA